MTETTLTIKRAIKSIRSLYRFDYWFKTTRLLLAITELEIAIRRASLYNELASRLHASNNSELKHALEEAQELHTWLWEKGCVK